MQRMLRGLSIAITVAPLLSSPGESQDLSGHWLVRASTMDMQSYQKWNIEQGPDGTIKGLVSAPGVGTLKLAGKVNPSGELTIELRREGNGANTWAWRGRVEGDRLAGEGIWQGGSTWNWVAERMPKAPARPSTRTYLPNTFPSIFSANLPPAMRLAPRDTLRTTTIDVNGFDATGKKRAIFGMLTGPFYIEGAIPGEVIAVRLTRVRTNKESGSSLGLFHPSSVTAPYFERQKKDRPMVEWRIDTGRRAVSVKDPGEKLAKLEIPLRPMLGMIGVAPPRGMAVGPNILGPWGGNLDYNRIEEGAVVYLPVLEPGALLYFGDGHAAQGDGEISGAGIETSLDVELVVDLISGRSISTPRIETSTELISVASAGSLDAAMQLATTDLAQWLESAYGLSSSDAALVLGQAIQLDIAQVVGRDRTVGARVSKRLLSSISSTPK